MTTAEMPHAFISFSSKDEKQARALCEEMEKRNVPCWISARDVRPGRNYQTEIIEAIRSANHLLLVFSANACRTEEVSRELSLASRHHVRICPVRIEDVQPVGGMEFMLATSQWVDAFQDWDEAMDKLAREIGGSVVGPEPGSADRKGGIGKFLAAGAVAIVLLAGGAYGLFKPAPPMPHPSSTVVTAPPPPAPPPPPDPAAIQGNVETLVAGLDCAGVLVESQGNSAIGLSGFVKSAADAQRLIAAARPLHVQNDLDIAPWPFCAVRRLGPSLGAADDIEIEINHPDGRYALGDLFAGSVSAYSGQTPIWLELVLIDPDGTVSALLAPSMAKPHDRVTFGVAPGQQFTAQEPTGKEMLLAFASDRPLPPPDPDDNTARTYLAKLQDTLAHLGGRISMSTRSIIVVRQK